MSDAANDKDPLRSTLNLPKTSFSMKANLLQMEPAYQKRWDKLGLYERLRSAPHPKGDYPFHDGPPYANGNIHLGHLLNKVLKDLVVRSRTMAGYNVDYVPGWDCHGLPIEHQVMKELGEDAKSLDTLQIRGRCQRYAEKFVKVQSRQMQRLGTEANYDNPYLTMSPAFEGATLELFATLVERGIVYRDLKPVHWSVANRTALAEAELEYYDRDDISVFVGFDVVSGLPEALKAAGDARLLIWTTTPWTLPANLAVAVAEGERYGSYRTSKGTVVVAEALAEKVFAAAGVSEPALLGSCTGKELVGVTYQHPFIDRRGKVVTADYVTVEDGTGLVHTAPGHGEEDYRTGLREGLEIYCPVRGDGTYDDTVPEWLRGKSVWDANPQVVEHLRKSGHLFFDQVFNHSYPHDWRSKTPTIFRATEQWFIAVDREVAGLGKSLRDMALQAAEGSIEFVPAWGQNRLRGMLEARPDWCVSRQRAWGLPIPAFIKEDAEPLLTPMSVRAVAKVVRAQGSDAWFKKSVTELLAEYDPAADEHAPAWLRTAGKKGLSELEKSKDIFDVWFESGASWHAVMRERGLGFPVELYLEGADQHRGWFQLSLLPALGATGAPPFKRLLTHGFTLDAKGHPMSKSLGNVIGVDELMEKYGADICRWWVAGVNYTQDIRADWSFFAAASDDYRKVRNTLRFFLGTLGDFDPAKHTYTFTEADAHSVDAWALAKLDEMVEEVLAGYEAFQYRRLRDALFNFLNDTMSAVYLAAIKDRLYCDHPDAPRRRRTQTALYEIASATMRLLAPVLVHTADQAWLSLHGEEPDTSERCIHLEPLPTSGGRKPGSGWEEAMLVRGLVLKALEEAKSRGINNPLEAGVVVRVPAEQQTLLAPLAAELTDLCGVSRLRVEVGEGVEIEDLRQEPRCARSWKRDGTVKLRDNGLVLSDRDADVLARLGKP